MIVEPEPETYRDAADPAVVKGRSPNSKRPPPRCQECTKKGEIPLNCMQHHFCRSCFKKKIDREGTEEMYICRVCPVAAPPSSPVVPVFVDHSNLWIEAQKLGGKIKNFTSNKRDNRVRINYGQLKGVIAGERKLDPTVYVSDENLKLSNCFKVKRLEKSQCSRKEKEVDATICKDMQALTTVPSAKRGTAILVSGDRDMRPAVEEILKSGWSVEIYMWKDSIAKGFHDIEGNVKIIPLNEYWDKIVDISKKIPKDPSFSVVLTVTRGKFSRDNRIDPEWWNQVEQVCKWPICYKWLPNANETDEARHLLLVFTGMGEKLAKKLDYEKLHLRDVEHCETYANFLGREKRGPARRVTEDEDFAKVVKSGYDPRRALQPQPVYAAEPGPPPVSLPVPEPSDKEEARVTDDEGWTEVKRRRGPKSEPAPPPVESHPKPPVNVKRREASSGTTSLRKQPCCSGKNCEVGLNCIKYYSHSRDDINYFDRREGGLGNKFRKTHMCKNYPHCQRSTIECDFAHGESDGWCSNCHSPGHFRRSCPNQECQHPKHSPQAHE